MKWETVLQLPAKLAVNARAALCDFFAAYSSLEKESREYVGQRLLRVETENCKYFHQSSSLEIE